MTHADRFPPAAPSVISDGSVTVHQARDQTVITEPRLVDVKNADYGSNTPGATGAAGADGLGTATATITYLNALSIPTTATVVIH